MRIYRLVILFILGGATAVLLGTAVYAYHLTAPPQPYNNYQPASQQYLVQETDASISLVMEEGGLHLLSAARWLSQDWRRSEFSLDSLRLVRFSDTARFPAPTPQTELAETNAELPGPVNSAVRQNATTAKSSSPCPPSAVSQRVIWPRPWPTTPNPAAISQCPDPIAAPLLADMP